MTSSNRLLFHIISLLIAVNLAQAVNNNQKRQVIISFDDGYYTIYKYAYPILKKYDVPSTIALIASYLKDGQPRDYARPLSFMNIGEVRQMVDNLDIEIASHSMTHHDLTRLDMKGRQYELERSKKLLDSLFNQTTITFVYPYGRTDAQLIDLTKAVGYQLGRSTRWGEPNLWVDRYKIPIYEVRATTTPDQIISHIKHHKTTVLLFHRILPQPSVFTEWSQSQFNQLLATLTSYENYGISGEIELITLKDLYLKWWQEIMTKYLAQKGWLQLNPAPFDKVKGDNLNLGDEIPHNQIKGAGSYSKR